MFPTHRLRIPSSQHTHTSTSISAAFGRRVAAPVAALRYSLSRACMPAAVAAGASTASVEDPSPVAFAMHAHAVGPHADGVPSASQQSPGRQALSVAPMMEWTDCHWRSLARLISRRTWLYTEMVVDKTILHTQNLDRFLWFPPEQHPVVLQLGGSDPETLGAATRIAVRYGYDEINLNCGCPSDRVAGSGCFGASLMLQPELVAACMQAIADNAGGTPVTVKCRLGVDEVDSYEALKNFVATVSGGSPVRHFIVHARKCFLAGLNPSQNRTVPPLRPEWVYSLKRDFPHLQFSLNGGVEDAYEARADILYEGPWPTPGFVETRIPLPAGNAPAPGAAEGAAARSSAAATGASSCAAEAAAEEAEAEAAAAVVHVAARGMGELDLSEQDHAGAAGNGSASSHQQQQHARQTSALAGGAEEGQEAGPTGHEVSCSYEPLGASAGLIEGVMIGRAAYNSPWYCLGDADRAVFGESRNPASSRRQVLMAYSDYADSVIGRFGTKKDGSPDPGVKCLLKPLANLFHAEPGNKRWKNTLDAVMRVSDPPKTVREALALAMKVVPDEILDSPPRQSDAAPRPRCFGPMAGASDLAGFGQSMSALRWAMKGSDNQNPAAKASRVTPVKQQQQKAQGQDDAAAGGSARAGEAQSDELQATGGEAVQKRKPCVIT